MKIFFLFFFLVPLLSFSQSAKFREIKIEPSSQNKIDDINYPVIVLNNKVAGKKINDIIKHTILDYSEEPTLDSAIFESTHNGLRGVDYEILHNKNGILSLKIRLENEGAYPIYSNEYFNFDLNRGATISLKEIFLPGKFQMFQKMVNDNKKAVLKNYRLQMKKSLTSKEIDSVSYDWAISEVNEYFTDPVSFKEFVLTKTLIEVFDDCNLPHAILYLSPDCSFQYKLSNLKSFLKPTIYKKLTQ